LVAAVRLPPGAADAGHAGHPRQPVEHQEPGDLHRRRVRVLAGAAARLGPGLAVRHRCPRPHPARARRPARPGLTRHPPPVAPPSSSARGAAPDKIATTPPTPPPGDEFTRTTTPRTVWAPPIPSWAKDEVVVGLGRWFADRVRLYGQISYAFMLDVPGLYKSP